jgi:uncharacterized MAPEG superfamily protein
MSRDQKIVAAGALSGLAAMVLLLWLLTPLMPVPDGADIAGNRIAYALRWNGLAAIPLIAMLGAIGNARAMSEAIDPMRGKESEKMRIDARVASNTLEQFVLFCTATLALAASVSGSEVRFVAAAAIAFVILRFAFWIGYRIHPLYRAFGFAPGFYMTLGMLIWSLWLSLR